LTIKNLEQKLANRVNSWIHPLFAWFVWTLLPPPSFPWDCFLSTMSTKTWYIMPF